MLDGSVRAMAEQWFRLIREYVAQLIAGATSLESYVSTLISPGNLAIPVPPPGHEHTSIV
jgi:hypothetical protein